MKKIGILLLFVLLLSGCSTTSDQTEVLMFRENLLAVKLDDKWGYIDKKGETVLPALYDYATAFYNNRAIVEINGKMQIIDKTGKNILNRQYDDIYRDNESFLFIYKDNEKYGLMNASGVIITDALYDDIGSFSSGLAYVQAGSKYGYIDTKGTIKISVIYDDAYAFMNDLAVVEKNGLYGYINKKGDVVIDFTFSYATNFDEYGNAIVKVSQSLTYSLYNKKSKTFILSNKDSISGNGPIYTATTNKEVMLYNLKGERFNTEVYSRSWSINGYFANLNYGTEDMNFWFNEDGSVKISADYYDSDYGKATINGKKTEVFVISNNGTSTIHMKNKSITLDADSIVQFLNKDLFVVDRENKIGIIDKQNNIKLNFLYDGLFVMDDGYILFLINGKFGIMDSNYKTIVTAKYDSVNTFI